MTEVTLNILQDFTRLDKLDNETRQIVDGLIIHNQQREVSEPSTHDRGVITREFTAWCGLCEEWQQETGRSIKHAEKKFVSWGWSKTRKHGWLCPDCAKKD